MHILIVSCAITVALFSFGNTVPSPQSAADKFDDFDERSPVVIVAAEFATFDGMKCRKGFGNLSDDVVDATNICAGISGYKQLGRRRMGERKVNMEGATPNLCLRACVLNHTGMMNTHRQGVNETGMMEVYKKIMSKPGGEKSAFRLVKEIMDCNRKHFVVFSNHYSNCSEAEDFLRCSRRSIMDCGEKNTTGWDILYTRYLEKKKKKRDQLKAQGIPVSSEENE